MFASHRRASVSMRNWAIVFRGDPYWPWLQQSTDKVVGVFQWVCTVIDVHFTWNDIGVDEEYCECLNQSRVLLKSVHCIQCAMMCVLVCSTETAYHHTTL